MMEEQQLLGIQFEGEFLRGVEMRHRVSIGVKQDVAAPIGADGPNYAIVVGHDRQGPESGFFLDEQFNGFAMGFAVEADIGHGVTPLDGGRINRGKRGDFQATEEVLLYVTHAIFHAPFFVGLADLAGDGFEAVVRRQVKVTRMKQCPLAQPIDPHFRC